jgi:hypothetical protein
MVVPNPGSNPYRILGEDGQVAAYVVSAEQMQRMQDEIASLREQLATAVRERDHHLAKREELIRTRFPLPPTEDEIAAAVDNADEVARLIAGVRPISR